MPKNVIMISVDDMIDVVRYRDAFGTGLLTPNIDRLMAMGVTFGNAFTPVPLCGPARAAVLTGQSPFDTGIHHNTTDQLHDVFPIEDTLFGAFSDAGFYIAARGKMLHLHDSEPVEEYLKPILDEGEWRGGYDNGGGDLFGTELGDSPVPEEEMIDAITGTWAADFLNRYDHGGDPFFLSVGFHRPHLGWDVPKEYYDLYDLNDIAVPAIDGVSYDDLPAFFQNLIGAGDKPHDKVIDAGAWAELVRAYMAAISFADAQVGKVLDAIDANGLWDTSTVVLWSDHGYHLGDRDVWQKFTLWEEAASVPFIIADPDLDRGRVIDAPVSLLDVWPTIAGLTGINGPENPRGLDLAPLMLGDVDSLPREGVVTSAYGSLSVRTGTWRYTLYQSGEEELFRVDRGQIHGTDVSSKAKNADILLEMRELLKAEASEIGVEVADVVTRGTQEDDVFTVIDGGTAQGGKGDDIYLISDGGTVIEKWNGGHDKLFVSTDTLYKLAANVEDAELTFHSDGDLKGNWLDNSLTGSVGSNTIRGAKGHDELDGGKGNDTLRGDNGNDVLNGGAGNDTLTGGGGRDTFVFTEGRDVIADFERNDTILVDEKWNHVRQKGDDVVLVFDDGRLTVEHVTFSDIKDGLAII